ncbi:MAG: cyanophycin synthetase [Pseudomonadota bacterium]
MKIIKQRFLRGPNLYADKPCLLTILDLEELDGVASNSVPGFVDALLALMPSLSRHRCSVGRPGGFVQRLRDGTYMAHIVEHVTLELQCLAGSPAGFGRTRKVAGAPGQFRVVCAYQLEKVVELALRVAIDAVSALARGEAFELGDPLALLKETAARRTIGTSTAAVLDAARRRGIPSVRITEDANLFQLGWGSRQRRLQATMTGATSNIAVHVASNKQLTKALLEQSGIPVPKGETVTTAADAVLAARRLRCAVTIKPLDANQGKGVTTTCRTPEQVTAAFAHARKFSRSVIVEQFLEGQDYRVLVAGDEVAAASCRLPPSVIGDGIRSIRALVALENSNPARGAGHSNILTEIALDDHADMLVREQGFALDDVPPLGRTVQLRGNANLSTGGTAEDVTDLLPDCTRRLCVRAAQKIGLDVAGIDIVCRDISLPLSQQRGGIIEVNAAPGIRMHQYPSRGKARDAGDAIVESMFGSTDGRIPIIAVTGTNGKTTTTLMLAHGARLAGHSTGATTTEGVFINGVQVVKGDCSGYWSARNVLSAPDVDIAVLETARGGILKRGLGFDRCDVSVVLNVSADHLGLDGVETLADLARVKGVVARAASKALVLNADDPLCLAMAGIRRKGAEVLYFSMDADNPALLRHLEDGGRAAYLEDGAVILADSTRRHSLIEAALMPVSLGGHAKFNIANALATAAGMLAAGFDIVDITVCLSTFVSNGRNNPLRANSFDVRGVKVIVDYAHNPAAYAALGEMGASMGANRVVAVLTAPGDRREADLREIGRTCARAFHALVVYESDGRGRPMGETARVILDGARDEAGAHHEHHCKLNIHEAVRFGLTLCHEGDVLIFACPSSPMELVEALRASDAETAARIAAELSPSSMPHQRRQADRRGAGVQNAAP